MNRKRRNCAIERRKKMQNSRRGAEKKCRIHETDQKIEDLLEFYFHFTCQGNRRLRMQRRREGGFPSPKESLGKPSYVARGVRQRAMKRMQCNVIGHRQIVSQVGYITRSIFISFMQCISYYFVSQGLSSISIAVQYVSLRLEHRRLLIFFFFSKLRRPYCLH